MTAGNVTGYSGKPLHQKLALKPGMTCLTIAAPDHYPALIADAEGVSVVTMADKAQVVHLFCRKARDLAAMAEAALSHVAEGGMLWVSWPKKSSSLIEELTEDGLREILLPLGWVDVKVCAVDKGWSGLKFLKRRSKTG